MDEQAPRRVIFRGHAGVAVVASRWAAPHAGTALLLHGGGQTRHSWRRAAGLIRRHRTVVAPDVRGHGDSGWSPDGDYRLPTLRDDVLCVLDQIASPTVIVGSSLGGLTGLLAAERAGPATVAGLVLVDAVPHYDPAGGRRIRDFMRQHPDGFATVDEAAARLGRFRDGPDPPADRVRRNLREGADGRWYWHWDPAFMFRPDNDPIRYVSELERAAAAITVPLLLIRGARSDVVRDDGVRRLSRIAPHARVVELPGAAHVGPAESNDGFAALVAGFVAGCDGPGATGYPARPPTG
jgi:pimeloyl-ACP methyl ester carboxylesterase